MDTIVFKCISDTQSALLSYQQGDIDFVNLQSDQAEAYSDDEGFATNLGSDSWYLCFNYLVDELNNDNLRTALSYAVDRDSIVDEVLKDGSIALDGVVVTQLSPGPTGNDFRDDSGSHAEYDPDLAAEYYAAAVEELGTDVTLELLYEDTDVSKSVAENLQAQIQEACPGITITLNSKPKKTRIELMLSGDFQLVLTKWGVDFSDPQSTLDLFKTGASYNFGRYSSEEYDEIMNRADSGEDAADEEARWADYVEAENILISQDHAIVPIYQDGGSVLMNPEYENIAYQMVGGYDFTAIHHVE